MKVNRPRIGARYLVPPSRMAKDNATNIDRGYEIVNSGFNFDLTEALVIREVFEKQNIMSWRHNCYADCC